MTERPTDPRFREVDPFEGTESVDRTAPEVDEDVLDESTIEGRAARGVGLLGGQMLALQVLTIGVTVVLARLLSVSDYGVFAIALALQQAGLHLVELGIPAALINRDRPPNAHEQRAVTGLVLGLALGICGLVALLAYGLLPALGADDNPLKLALIACLALPLLAFRAVPALLLERKLLYGRLTVMYSVDTITFNLAALGGALAGWGGYSLVAGVPAGALAGTLTALFLQRSARGVTWDFSVIRPLIGFGSQVGVRQGIIVGRDLAFVSLIVLVGSQTAAGFFAMSQRVLGVPIALSMALGRVAFPAMARDETDSNRIETTIRSVGVASVAIGLPIAVCAGAAEPLLDFLFGSRWIPASEVVVPSAAGVFLMASGGSILASLFLSLGDARPPLMSTIVDSLVLCVSVIFLVQWNQTAGIGLSIALGACVGVALLLFRSPREVRVASLAVLKGLLICAVAAAAGLFLPVGNGIDALIAVVAASSIVWLTLSVIFSRPELSTLLTLVRRGIPKRSAA